MKVEIVLTPEQEKARAYARKHNRLLCYRPTAKGKKFHKSRHKRRVVRAPNQVGKTRIGAVEAWLHALDLKDTGPGSLGSLYPEPWKKCPSVKEWLEYRKGKNQIIGLIVIAKAANKKPVSRALYNFAPHDFIDWSLTKYDAANHWGRSEPKIILLDGSVINITWSSADVTTIAGDTVDWNWIDEPPAEDTLDEIIMRGVRRKAPVWMTFTPIAEYDLTWLKHKIQGDKDQGIEPKEDWDQTVIKLSLEDCPFLDEETIELQKKGVSKDQYPQRIEGEWDGLNDGRAFSEFDDLKIVSREEIPDTDIEAAIGIDHGELAGHQAVILILYSLSRRKAWIAKEWTSDKATTFTDDAKGIIELLESFEIEPANVSVWVGDINRAGKGENNADQSCNDVLGALLDVYIEKPFKGSGSIEADVKRINEAFKEEILYVSNECGRVCRGFRYWEGGNDSHKHVLDGCRYALQRVLKRIGVARPSRPRKIAEVTAIDITNSEDRY